MNETEKSNWTQSKKTIVVFVILAITFAALTTVPSIRTQLTSVFQPQNRKVLAKITGYFDTEQTQFLILKVKDALGLKIEIFQIDTESTAQKFLQKFDLNEDADAYVTLDKNSTNLALQDVDQDGNLDVIAPSVDRNGNLRLNTFRYNAELKMFEPHVAAK